MSTIFDDNESILLFVFLLCIRQIALVLDLVRRCSIALLLRAQRKVHVYKYIYIYKIIYVHAKILRFAERRTVHLYTSYYSATLSTLRAFCVVANRMCTCAHDTRSHTKQQVGTPLWGDIAAFFTEKEDTLFHS